jgi:hypothetical protein
MLLLLLLLLGLMLLLMLLELLLLSCIYFHHQGLDPVFLTFSPPSIGRALALNALCAHVRRTGSYVQILSNN